MKYIILFIALIVSVQIFSQSNDEQILKGTVHGKNEKSQEPLEGAVIRWINTKSGTLTDASGKFEISSSNISDRRIIVNYIGYKKDTIDVNGKNSIDIILESTLSTQQIDVHDHRNSSYIEDHDKKTEVISQVELKKEACCDLSGCFGKNASVDVAVTDILTNTKELKVLGLEGAYTQVLVDNMPIMSGLSTKYGVTSLPGTLIDKITISKGSNSVMQGYESISGIMNILLKDYGSSERFMLNGFMNDMLEKQINIQGTANLKKWNTLLAFQTVQEPRKMDENNDGFLDAPLTTRYMIYNKWKYGNSEDDKTSITVGLKLLDEKRIGGQTNFDYDKNLGSNTIYGQTVKIQNGDLYTRISQKTGKESQLKFFLSGSFFNQNSYYGEVNYVAKQRNAYLNAIYEFPISESNFLRFGGSYKFEQIKENISYSPQSLKTYAGQYDKMESIPGVFSEASFAIGENTSLIAGLRLDYHNKHNLITTPRFLIRHQLTKLTVIRASFGTGFRTVNLFSEYSNLLASGRNILMPDEVKPERMINYGIDLLQYFDFKFISGNINFDFYRTNFSNKVIPDYEKYPYAVTFINNNNAVSNVFQIEANTNILRNIDFKLAYKFIDQSYNENNVKYKIPFTPNHRILSSISYSPYDKNWNVNMTLQWFGKQSLPSTKWYPVEFQRPSESESYMIINGQVSKFFKHFEIYGGIENLLDFKQGNPIIDPQNPFSKNFDTSYIWGPTSGRTFYMGFRLLFD